MGKRIFSTIGHPAFSQHSDNDIASMYIIGLLKRRGYPCCAYIYYVRF